MDWSELIRRITRRTGHRVDNRLGDGVLAILFVAALTVGGPSALTGLGKFAQAITPSRVSEAANKPAPGDRREILLSGFSTLSSGAPHVLRPAEDLAAAATPGPALEPKPAVQLAANPPPPEAPIKEAAIPAIAICVDDLGPNLNGTEKAMALPQNVTLSFLPYARATPRLAREAEAEGHEVLAHVPMEAIGPQDPGPMTLKVDSPDIHRRLVWALARVPGLKGINNHEGSKFSTDAASLVPVAEALARRHLFFFDSRTIAGSEIVRVSHEFGVPSAGRDVFLDDIISVSAIQAQLDKLVEKAKRRGIAIAIGHPHDITLAILSAWLAKDHGVRLVPVSEAIRLKMHEPSLLAAR